jgi:hypothetical protein
MVLKTKLSLGIGFLFIIIFALAGFCSYYIQKLSYESDNILKNNYNSIVYSKNMLLALDDMNTSMSSSIINPNAINKSTDYYVKLFDSAKIEFEKNVKAEINNITEIHEAEYVDILKKTYDIYMNLCVQIRKGSGNNIMYFNELLPAYEKLRQTISNINDINMHAVVRKNQLARQDSARLKNNIAIMITICIMLAFGYFWYFPFYVSNSLSYLSEKMKQLLKDTGITLDIKSNDETDIILQSINLLGNRFSLKEKGKQ